MTIKWSSLSRGGNVCDNRENKVKTDDGQNRHTVQLTNVTLAIVKGTHCDRRAGRHILSYYYNLLLLYRVAHKKSESFHSIAYNLYSTTYTEDFYNISTMPKTLVS